VRRLFEAWKRALDATIEVPDREPAINALSSSSSSCRRKRAYARERETESAGGSREKIEEEESRNARQRYSEGAKTTVERAWLCLLVKALGGRGRATERVLSKNTLQRNSASI